jgi:hypothetical protein
LVSALVYPDIRGRFLHMPNLHQQEENKNAVLLKYKLPNVIRGVDGCNFPFVEKPRRIPAGRNPRSYINRDCW